jgi:hypothetical protein
MTQQSAKLFVTNDLLLSREWIINLSPVPSERSIVQRLMWSQLVVKICITRDKMIEVLLAKDNEIVEAFKFY